jgi:mannose-1-phosphate guanylyltransferase
LAEGILLVGGFGTRLRPLTNGRPKPMLPIASLPVTEHQLAMARRAGIKRIVLATSYLSEVFIPYFGDGSKWGMEIRYAVEKEPLGTGGAIRNAAKELAGDDQVVIFNGDVLSSHNLKAQLDLHISSGADVTLHLTPVEDARAYGCVPTDSEGRVTAFLEKMDNPITNIINAGCYVFDKSVIASIPENEVVSVERQTFPQLIEANKKVMGFIEKAYWLDIGTPNALMKGSRDLVTGVADQDALDKYKFAHRDSNYVSLSENISGSFINGSAIGGHCTLTNCIVDASIISDGVEAQNCTIRNSFIEVGAHLEPNSVIENSFVDPDGEISPIFTTK